MKYIARRVLLRDGERCVLRSPEPRDAAQRIAFLRAVNGETAFLARSADDSPADVQMAAEVLADQLEDGAQLEIAAYLGDAMVACGGIHPVSRAYPRKRHRAQLGICVLRAHWGRGLAAAILTALIREAPGMGYAQIELSAADGNDRAMRLYERLGFVETGRTPRALRYEDGRFCDEIHMVRVL